MNTPSVDDSSKNTFAAMLEIDQQRNQMLKAVVTLEEQNKRLKEDIDVLKSECQKKDIVIQQKEEVILSLTKQ